MIIGLAVVSVVVGIITGWWLTVTVAAVAMSYSQERMQRKVRYWQAQADLARAHARAARHPPATLSQGDVPPHDHDRKQLM